MSRNCLVFALFAAVAITIAGCSDPSGVPGLTAATGTVTQNGAPLVGATVTFVPAPDSSLKAAMAVTEDLGRFQLTTLKAQDGAMPGEYLVTVTKTETVGKQYTPQEANEYYSKNMKRPPSPETKKLVAEKFSKGATSGLKATVKKGEKNEFTFNVE